jgi:DNA polymerase-3 subunit delta
MQEILRNIKSGNLSPIYFLHGEESYFIDVITDAIEKGILQDSEKSFNQDLFYGKEVSARQIVDACSQYPMMAAKRVVIVKEAQNIKDIKLLDKYVANPVPSTVLCMAYKNKKLDNRSAFAKVLKKSAVVFESKRLYDNQLPAYVSQLVKNSGRTIDGQAANLVAEYIGSDLSTLHNEMDKVFLEVEKGNSINAEVIQKQIGISKDFNVFEMQSALAGKNYQKVFRIAKYFQDNPKKNPMVMIVGTLFRFYSKVWVVTQNQGVNDNVLGKSIGVYNSFFMKEYRLAARNYKTKSVEKILQLLKEYDLKSKGVNNRSFNENKLLVELLGKILLA